MGHKLAASYERRYHGTGSRCPEYRQSHSGEREAKPVALECGVGFELFELQASWSGSAQQARAEQKAPAVLRAMGRRRDFPPCGHLVRGRAKDMAFTRGVFALSWSRGSDRSSGTEMLPAQ